MYWILLTLVVFGIFKYDFNNNNNGRDLLYYTTLALVIIISAFGYDLGSDAPRYQDAFETAVPTLNHLWEGARDTALKRWQIGFLLLMSTCKSITPSFYFFKFIYACIINVSIFSFFRKNTEHVFLALFFYIVLQGFYFNFDIFREALALSVFIWAYSFIGKKEWVKYYLLCFLAILFHLSAIILFFVPLFIRFLKVGSKQTLIVMAVINIVLIILGTQLSSIVGEIISFEEEIDSSYANYLQSEHYGGSRFSLTNVTTWATLLVDVVLPVVMLYVLPRKGVFRDYFPLIYIAVLLVVPAKFVLILFRFSNYFFVFKTLFYIEMFKYFCVKISNRNNYYLILVLFCFLYVGYFFSAKNFKANDYGFRPIDRYYPYVSIFNQT